MGKCIHKAKYINTREATTPSFGFRNIELGPHGLGPASKMYLKQDVLYPEPNIWKLYPLQKNSKVVKN